MHAADIWKAECLPGTTPLFYAGGETRGGPLRSGGLAGLSCATLFSFCREVCFDKTAYVAKHVWWHELGHLCAPFFCFYLLIWKLCFRSDGCAAQALWLVSQSGFLLPLFWGFIRRAKCLYSLSSKLLTQCLVWNAGGNLVLCRPEESSVAS